MKRTIYIPALDITLAGSFDKLLLERRLRRPARRVEVARRANRRLVRGGAAPDNVAGAAPNGDAIPLKAEGR